MRIDDEALFEASFRGFAGHVYAYASRRATADVAQDVTAETFLIAWRRREQIPTEPLPWLYGIARGVLANERRAANRRAALVARIAAEPAPIASGVEGHAILEAVARLSENDREVLLLTAWEGLSTKEASIVMGCSAATLAVRVHRARRRLARALAESTSGFDHVGLGPDGADRAGLGPDGADRAGISPDGVDQAGLSPDGADQARVDPISGDPTISNHSVSEVST